MILKGLSRDRGLYQVRIFNILCPSLIALQLDLRVLLQFYYWIGIGTLKMVGNAKYSVIPSFSKNKIQNPFEVLDHEIIY